MPKCPVCDAETPDGEERCSRCGFQFKETLHGDSRDSPEVEGNIDAMRKELKKKLNLLLAQLQNMDIANIYPEEIKSIVGESVQAMDIPLMLEISNPLKLSEQEMKLFETVTKRVDEAAMRESPLYQEAETYIKLANIFFWEENSKKAIEYLDTALLKEPKNETAMFNKSRILFNQQKYDDAISVLNKILKLNPESAQAMNFLELVKQMKERPE